MHCISGEFLAVFAMIEIVVDMDLPILAFGGNLIFPKGITTCSEHGPFVQYHGKGLNLILLDLLRQADSASPICLVASLLTGDLNYSYNHVVRLVVLAIAAVDELVVSVAVLLERSEVNCGGTRLKATIGRSETEKTTAECRPRCRGMGRSCARCGTRFRFENLSTPPYARDFNY
jgi:hypothetical protein